MHGKCVTQWHTGGELVRCLKGGAVESELVVGRGKVYN